MPHRPADDAAQVVGFIFYQHSKIDCSTLKVILYRHDFDVIAEANVNFRFATSSH